MDFQFVHGTYISHGDFRRNPFPGMEVAMRQLAARGYRVVNMGIGRVPNDQAYDFTVVILMTQDDDERSGT